MNSAHGHHVQASEHNPKREGNVRHDVSGGPPKRPGAGVVLVLVSVAAGLGALFWPAMPSFEIHASLAALVPAGLAFVAAAWVALSALWPS